MPPKRVSKKQEKVAEAKVEQVAEAKVEQVAEAKIEQVAEAKGELLVSSDKQSTPLARVRHFLDVFGVNKLVNEKTAEFKPFLQKYKRCMSELSLGRMNENKEFIPLNEEEKKLAQKFLEENAEKYDAVNAEKIELKLQRLRFSNEGIQLLFKVLHKIIIELLTLSAEKTIAANKSIVLLKFLFEESVITKSSVYPLICNLPSCKKLFDEAAAEKQEKFALDQFNLGYKKCLQDAKLKKKLPESSEEEPKPAVKEVAAPVLVKKKEKEYRGFETFVGSCSQQFKDKKLKFSKKLKIFISNLLVELLQKITEVIEVNISVLKVKTINAQIIKSIINTIMLSYAPLKYEYAALEMITKIDEKEVAKKQKEDEKRKLNNELKPYKIKGHLKDGIKITKYEQRILFPNLIDSLEKCQ